MPLEILPLICLHVQITVTLAIVRQSVFLLMECFHVGEPCGFQYSAISY